MKKSKYFNCKEKGHTTYDYSKKGKIAAISESVSKNMIVKKKNNFFQS